METKKEVKIESVSIADAENKNAEPAKAEVTESNARIAELEKSLAELNDKYLRMAAELENTRRRAVLDSESRARSRAISVAEKILPVMDAIDVALKHNPDDEGIKSMWLAMESAFEKIGITKIETVGKPLDPTVHNAIQVVAASDKFAPNTVAEELQAGYMMGDAVLRTAMVVVAK